MDYDQVLRSESSKEFRLSKGIGEDNWKSRMLFCNNLTEAITTHGSEGLPRDFTVQIEPYLNNLLDCAAAERTQLSIAACRLLEKLPEVLERDMHPHLDRILPVLIKLCANTKAVTVKAATQAVAGIVEHSNYNPRLLWHVCQVFDDKPAGPKIGATTWLQTILKKYHRYIDLSKDARMISRAVALALEDADANVRTKMRATYWTYSKYDLESAQEIMEKLNTHARTALQNDPNNPDKKTAAAKKEPPRPRSALADVRKEQAKKKRAEEEAQKQKKALHSSTASHDSIEIHEPKRDKPRREEKPLPPKPTTTDRTIDGWHPSRGTAPVPPPSHKKTLSQENELAKPTASSRLLSAPVRRPRYNITTMGAAANAPAQTSRPSSRTGQAPLPREKDSQKDSRPTSSSSWKAASIGNAAVRSPKLKPASNVAPISPQRHSATSPRAKGQYVPEGKENAMAPPGAKIRHSPSTTAPAVAAPLKEYPDVDQPAVRRAPVATPSKQLTERSVMAQAQYEHSHIPVQTHIEAPIVSAQQLPVRTKDKSLSDARRYLARLLPDFENKIRDPLCMRKLKNVADQFPAELVETEEIYDQLFDVSCKSLAVSNDPASQSAAVNNAYKGSLLLQMIMSLLKDYPTWAEKYYPAWIESMVYYRCMLSPSGDDRRVKYMMLSVSDIIQRHERPLDELTDSVLSAIEKGEPLLEHTGNNSVLSDSTSGICQYMRSSLSEFHNTVATTDKAHSAALSLLASAALEILTLILNRTIQLGQSAYLDAELAAILCEKAVWALNSYDFIVKKSTVPYIKGLHAIMSETGNGDGFFAYFTEESHQNLVQYYVYNSRRSVAEQDDTF